MKKKSILMLLTAMAAACSAQAQSIGPSTLNAAGGSGSIAGNSFEWSVGEMTMISTFSSATLVVTQGLLQPLSGATGVPNSPLITGNLVVFPNPAGYALTLQPRFQGPVTLGYTLFDMAGRLVLSRETVLKTGTEKQELVLQHLASGQYMLRVVLYDKGQQHEAAYKIQKN